MDMGQRKITVQKMDCDVEPQKKVLKSEMKYVIVSLIMVK